MKFIILTALLACAMAVPAHKPRMGLPRLPLSLILSGKMPLIDLDSKIVGGAAVTAHSLPFQVIMERQGALGSWSLSCGGSILDATTILNAAHCTVNSEASNLRIVAGEHDRSKNEGTEQIRYASKVTTHLQYNSRTYLNDISIIKVSPAFDLNSNVAKIALATGDPPATLTVSGWGTTSSGGSLSNVLLSVDVPVVSNTRCQADYSQETIADSMLCAGRAGLDSCQGDSGGPLFSGSGSSAVQHGVVSWGYSCAAAGYPGVYTRVTSFLTWIANNRN